MINALNANESFKKKSPLPGIPPRHLSIRAAARRLRLPWHGMPVRYFGNHRVIRADWGEREGERERERDWEGGTAAMRRQSMRSAETRRTTHTAMRRPTERRVSKQA